VDGEQNGWRLFPVVEDGKPKLKVQYLNDGEFLDCGEFVCLV
jgi:hypothetical protein